MAAPTVSVLAAPSQVSYVNPQDPSVTLSTLLPQGFPLLGSASTLVSITTTTLTPQPTTSTSPGSSFLPGTNSTSTGNFHTPTISATITSSGSVATESSTPKSTSNTGLKAGVGVLGGLLAIALIALAFVLLRKRRSYGVVETVETPEKGSVKGAVVTTTIRGNPVDDIKTGSDFEQLFSQIRDWVLQYYKVVPAIQPSGSLAETLQRVVPNYARMIPDHGNLVVQAVLADILTAAIARDDFLATGFGTLSKQMRQKLSPGEWTTWRVQTLNGVLDPDYSPIVGHIASVLAPFGQQTPQQLEQLRNIVKSAARLNKRLAFMSARFDIIADAPGTPFDAETMEDVTQTHLTTEDGRGPKNQLSGTPISSVVFPHVIRYSDEGERSYDRKKCIYRAKVKL